MVPRITTRVDLSPNLDSAEIAQDAGDPLDEAHENLIARFLGATSDDMRTRWAPQ